MLITEKRLEQALKYISQTDEEMGRLEGLCKGYKRQEKITFSQAYKDSQGGSVAEREANARLTNLYIDFISNYNDRELEKDIMKTKRDFEYTIVEVFRTESANQRKGNV